MKVFKEEVHNFFWKKSCKNLIYYSEIKRKYVTLDYKLPLGIVILKAHQTSDKHLRSS